MQREELHEKPSRRLITYPPREDWLKKTDAYLRK
jgi:hypothetical protein